MTPAASAYTAAYTNSPETEHADPLKALAAVLLSLSPAERERLAKVLTGEGGER